MGMAGAWYSNRSSHDTVEQPSAPCVAATVDHEVHSMPGLRCRDEQMDDATIAAINAMMCDPLERIWHDR